MRTKCRFYSLNKKRQCCLDSHHSLIIDFITTNGKQKDCKRPRANENMGKRREETACREVMCDRYAEGSPPVLGKEGIRRAREGDDSRKDRTTPRMCMKQLENKYTKTVQDKRENTTFRRALHDPNNGVCHHFHFQSFLRFQAQGFH